MINCIHTSIFPLNTQSSATVKNSFSRSHFYLSCFSFSTSTGPHPASFRSSWSYTMLLAVALTEAGAAEQFSAPLVSALGIGGTIISLICPSSLHPFDRPAWFTGLFSFSLSFLPNYGHSATQSWLLLFIKFCLDIHNSWIPCFFLKTVEHTAGTRCVLLVGWLNEYMNECSFLKKLCPSYWTFKSGIHSMGREKWLDSKQSPTTTQHRQKCLVSECVVHSRNSLNACWRNEWLFFLSCIKKESRWFLFEHKYPEYLGFPLFPLANFWSVFITQLTRNLFQFPS